MNKTAIVLLWCFCAPAGAAMTMTGALGPYPAGREASGTSWQPDAAPVAGTMKMAGSWMWMLDADADLVYDRQGGPRGDHEWFVPADFMAMGASQAGGGTLGLHGMFSLDPLIGASGYPLLFQAGETAEGSTTLGERQHPHDFFMELAGTYSVPVRGGSLFLYAGLPGEPALGPPAFMHRGSAEYNPEAPLTHHWLHSPPPSFAVAPAGSG